MAVSDIGQMLGRIGGIHNLHQPDFAGLFQFLAGMGAEPLFGVNQRIFHQQIDRIRAHAEMDGAVLGQLPVQHHDHVSGRPEDNHAFRNHAGHPVCIKQACFGLM